MLARKQHVQEEINWFTHKCASVVGATTVITQHRNLKPVDKIPFHLIRPSLIILQPQPYRRMY